jgi:hypothetical protein
MSFRPTYKALKQCLERMRDHCIQNGVSIVGIPRLGCGLDKLNWDKVKSILFQTFTGTGITINVFSLGD